MCIKRHRLYYPTAPSNFVEINMKWSSRTTMTSRISHWRNRFRNFFYDFFLNILVQENDFVKLTFSLAFLSRSMLSAWSSTWISILFTSFWFFPPRWAIGFTRRFRQDIPKKFIYISKILKFSMFCGFISRNNLLGWNLTSFTSDQIFKGLLEGFILLNIVWV